MPWTSPRTWINGEEADASQLNSNIRDNLSWLFNAVSWLAPPTSGDGNRSAADAASAVSDLVGLDTDAVDTRVNALAPGIADTRVNALAPGIADTRVNALAPGIADGRVSALAPGIADGRVNALAPGIADGRIIQQARTGDTSVWPAAKLGTGASNTKFLRGDGVYANPFDGLQSGTETNGLPPQLNVRWHILGIVVGNGKPKLRFTTTSSIRVAYRGPGQQTFTYVGPVSHSAPHTTGALPPGMYVVICASDITAEAVA